MRISEIFWLVYKNDVGEAPDINRNLSGKWYGYGNSTCSAWLSNEACTEEKVKKDRLLE
jgi:hypothetical protein